MIIINYNIESEDKGSLPLFHKIFHQNFTQPIHQHLLSKLLISSCFPKTKYFDLRTIYLQLHDGFPVWIAIVRIFSSYLQKKVSIADCLFRYFRSYYSSTSVSSDHFCLIFWEKNMTKQMIVRKNQTNKEMKFSWLQFFI